MHIDAHEEPTTENDGILSEITDWIPSDPLRLAVIFLGIVAGLFVAANLLGNVAGWAVLRGVS
jgi:hypothetical protein